MDDSLIAYFSMEIALEPDIPTYSGGLGVLAGDTIRSAADLGLPMVAVSMLYRKGYFKQELDSAGNQVESPVEWDVDAELEKLDVRTSVTLEGREVHIQPYRYVVEGVSGDTVSVIFLDTDLPENHEEDRRLSHTLYGGDDQYRLRQEAVLGIGGVRVLNALGCRHLVRYHMNEGHAALLTLELLRQRRIEGFDTPEAAMEWVRQRCIFTTHTPVPAGHDRFPVSMVRDVLGGAFELDQWSAALDWDDVVNMTELALELSGYINGVAKKHGEVSRQMFSGYTIDSITNGVHPDTWTAEPFKKLFDEKFPDWRKDTFVLRHARSVSLDTIWERHHQAKGALINYVNEQADVSFSPEVLTIGYARRATAYKRGGLLFEDIERLRKLAQDVGRIQVVYAGKAHPRDEAGKGVIKRVFEAKEALAGDIPIAYLEGYGMELGLMLTSGVDVWLNTPDPPNEASGTSGMKAALNGVPSLSILDGWWIEGHIEGVTGWSIGREARRPDESHDSSEDAQLLYRKLEDVVVPTFYGNREQFVDIMREAIAINGSFFHTQRMLQQYVVKAYFRRSPMVMTPAS